MANAYYGVKNNANYIINTVGQLFEIGRNRRFNTSLPTILGNNTWSKVSSEYYHSLAIRSDGTLWAWGSNSYGQLGQSNTIGYSSPVQVGTSAGWSSIAAGYSYSLAIRSDGTLWAWGNNTYGQLGLSESGLSAVKLNYNL